MTNLKSVTGFSRIARKPLSMLDVVPHANNPTKK